MVDRYDEFTVPGQYVGITQHQIDGNFMIKNFKSVPLAFQKLWHFLREEGKIRIPGQIGLNKLKKKSEW